MPNNKNVSFKHSLEEYNKKYSNKNLKKVSKIEADKNPSLLSNKNWWLINDTYYEVTSNKLIAWWNALPQMGKIATCAIAGVGVVSAVVFPTLAATVWNKGGKPVDPEPIKEWYEDENYISKLTTDDVTKGTIKEVIVNGQVHKVRLIGIEQDKYDDNGTEKTAHTTWEFVNLISDSEGYSLAYQWHDTTYAAGSQNRNYPDSSIRKVLCGNGNFTTNVYCATKSSAHSSTTSENSWDSTYTFTSTNNKTVLSMLPTKLQNVLKTVKKNVRTGSDLTTQTQYTDKLFLLTAKELGFTSESKDEGTVYKYYEGADDSKRIKHQIKGSDGALTNTVGIKTSGPTYKDTVYSRAGYNDYSESTYGGDYWVCSPLSSKTNFAWGCSSDGSNSNYNVYMNANGVAPAFCL